MSGPELVVVGASWGGLEAVARLLDHLPKEFECPMVLVQHRAPQPSQLGPLLKRHTSWAVCEVDDKESISTSTLYLAPPGYHLYVGKGHFELSTDEPVRWSRPSIDVTFSSAADTYADRLVGVVLTGANADGAEGLARVKRRGGATIVQDPDTAAKREMPQAAIATGAADHVIPLEGIGHKLVELAA
jgi:two-component system chemotaxis response regulator CheB